MIERLRNSTRGGASPVTARARRSRATFVWAWALAGSIPVISAFAAAGPAGQTPDDANRPPGRLVFCGAADNDLVRVAAECGILAERFDAPEQAVQAAPDGSGLLILADGYPQKTTEVSPAVFDDAAKKGLRVYVEYPASLPGLEIGKRGRTWLQPGRRVPRLEWTRTVRPSYSATEPMPPEAELRALSRAADW